VAPYLAAPPGRRPRTASPRVSDEARESEDPDHLIRAFGISTTTAGKYVHAAQPRAEN
jgi:hypothetical protein